MLFSPNTFLHNLEQELQAALFDAEVSYGVITNLYKQFCNFFHGCDKVESEHIKLLAHCCLKYIDCIQTHIDSTPTLRRIHIVALKELITVIGDMSKLEGVKDAYLLCITVPIFEKITEPDIKIWFAKELLKNFNLAVQGTRKHIRHAIVQNHPLYLCRLADIICTCGDYDYQVMLLEAIFRMCSEAQIKQYAHELFPTSVEFENGFCNINKDHFDKDVRTFLNMVNSELKKVLSLKCEIVQLGSMTIVPPKDPEQGELPIWADFNLGTRTITILCDKDSLRTGPTSENSDDEDFELITINVADISNVFMSRLLVPDRPYSIGFIILFNMIGSCSVIYPSSVEATKATQLKVAIYKCSELNELLNNLLPNWFGENFKRLTPPEEGDQKSRRESRVPIGTRGVYKPLEFDASSSDLQTDATGGSPANSGHSSQEDLENAKLKQRSTAGPIMRVASKAIYKPLVTEDSPGSSRPASALSSISSTSDAMSLKDRLHAHQAKHFIRTEKLRISKNPKISDVEQLKQIAADPEFALLAKRQEENRILANKEKLLTDSEPAKNLEDTSSDIMFVENNEIEQNSLPSINTKRRLSVAASKEISKVKWPWPKNVSVTTYVPASVPSMSVAVSEPVCEKEQSKNDCKSTRNTEDNNKSQNHHSQEKVEKSFPEKQTLDTLKDKTIPFLPTLKNTEFTKEESLKLKKKSKAKVPKKRKGSKTNPQKVSLRKSVRLEDQAKSKETAVNTESTCLEQPSTLHVLISGDLCGNSEPDNSMKNTENDLFVSQKSSNNRLCILVEDTEETIYETTNNVELNTNNLKIKSSETVEKHNELQLDSETQTYKVNTEVIDLTLGDNNDLGKTVPAQSEKMFNTESEALAHIHTKTDYPVDTEKGWSSDVVESSQLEESHKPKQKVSKQTAKPIKRGRPAKQKILNFKNTETSTNELLSDDITRHHGVSKNHEKKPTNDEPLNNNENESEMEMRSTKDDEDQVQTNKIQGPLNKETNEDRRSEPEMSRQDQIKKSLEMEDVFDSLLEEYMASQGNDVLNEKNIEEPLNTKPSLVTPLSEDTLTVKINRDEIQKQPESVSEKNKQSKSTIKKKTKDHLETLNDVSKEAAPSKKVTVSRKISQKKHKKGKLVQKEESPSKQEPNFEKKTTDEAYPSTYDTANEVPKESSSEEFFEAPRLTNKRKISQTKPKSEMEKINDKQIEESLPKENLNENGKNLENVEETSSQEFVEVSKPKFLEDFSKKIKLSRKNKMSHKKFKPEMPSNNYEPSQKDESTNKETSSKGAKKKTLDADNFKTCDIVKEIPNETSSEEFCRNIPSNKKGKMLRQRRKMESHKKTSVKGASARKERKSKRISKKGEITHLNFQEFNVQLQDSNVQEEVILTIEAIQFNTDTTKTNEAQLLLQSTSEQNLTPVVIDNRKRKVLPLPDTSDDDHEEVQVKEITPIIEMTDIIETNEDRLHNAVVNGESQKLRGLPESYIVDQLQGRELEGTDNQAAETAEEVRDKEITLTIEETHAIKTNENQVQKDKQQNLQSLPAGSFVEQLHYKELELNDTRAPETAQDVPDKEIDPTVTNTDDGIKTNENQDQNIIDKDKQQNRESLPVGCFVEQLHNKELEVNDTWALETAQEVQDKEIIPIADTTDGIEINENQVQKDKQQNLQSLPAGSFVEQLHYTELELNDTRALETAQEVQDKEIIPIADTTDGIEINENQVQKDKQQNLQSLPVGSFVEELHDQESEVSDISTSGTTRPKIAIIETNKNQPLEQNAEPNVSSLPDNSNNERFQEQGIIEEQAAVEANESLASFDQLLLQSALHESASAKRKRKMPPDNYYGETPKKKTGELAETDPAQEIIKINDKTTSTDLRKTKRIPAQARKLYNLDDTSYFDDAESTFPIREEPSRSTSHLVQSPNKEVQQKTNVVVEDGSVTFHKPSGETLVKKIKQTNVEKLEKPTTAINQHQNKDSQLENNNKMKQAPAKCNQDFKQPTKNTPTHQNSSETLVLQKPTNAQNKAPKRGSTKRSRKEEKKNCKKQRTSRESEQSLRRNSLESVSYTRAHLNSPKQLERNLQFSLLMQSLDSTLKQYTAASNDRKSRKSFKNYVSQKKTSQSKYEKLNLVERKQPKARSRKIKENKNIYGHYNKLLTQRSSPLAELSVEKEVMEITVIELLDSDDETDQGMQLNAERTISSKAINKNMQDNVSLAHQNKFAREEEILTCLLPTVTVEDRHKAMKRTPPISAKERAADEHYFVSPMGTPVKSVQAPSNIRSWVEGATIIQEVRELRGQVSNIERIVLNMQNIMLREKEST